LKGWRTTFRNDNHRWLWVPAFEGTTMALPPTHPSAYIQRQPQGALPHMAGSTPPAFVQGCRLNASVPLHSPCLKRFPMVNRLQFYIDGAWVDPAVKKSTP